LRRSLRWTVAVVGIFALGVAALWLLQVQPLQRELAAARDTLADLEAELVELRPLPQENAELHAALEQALQRQEVLRALVEVTTARAALAQGDPSAARRALQGTEARLKSLQTSLGPRHVERLSEMIDRLRLAQAGIGDNNFAALRDLEVLGNDLVTLEVALTR
jgi:chromosome segregation ATPase